MSHWQGLSSHILLALNAAFEKLVPSLDDFILRPLSGLAQIDVQHNMVVVGQYGIRANIQREDPGESEHFILYPLPTMVEVFSGIFVLAAKKTSSDSSADYMYVGRFSDTDLCIPWFGHGLLPYYWIYIYYFSIYDFSVLNSITFVGITLGVLIRLFWVS